ncbi:putative methyltransferase-domain-containing protein [Ephemerocybe angulata]|uniref:Putative methyltransferase-domain-containing protein n=1 Tax=Ephemerocybe angulata TaxID=980116 RepID=A0A8H6M8S7_9AGAR|nr:putative methyltransferase-domain-containing protein [Tulosesus angulatus]
MSDPNFPKDLNIKPLNAANSKYGTPTAFDDDFDLQAQQDAIHAYGIAGRVWEASYPMITYLNPPPSWLFDPPMLLKEKDRKPYSILELGSGTGIAASCMAEILREKDLLIVTDLPEARVCPLLEKNLSRHKSQPCCLAVRPLAWGSAEHAQKIKNEFRSLSLTHIVCSDLVYFPELLAPLLRSLIHLTSRNFSRPDEETTVVISYMIRSLTKEAPFWSTLGLWFKFYPVSYLSPREKPLGDREEEWHRFGSGLDDQVFVFIAHRRPESHKWTVPDSDVDLLLGTGANGKPYPQSDDTFESLLLLSMED